jgi:hypothetical protein
MPTPDAKAAAQDLVDGRNDDLVDLSHRIHAHQEIRF